MVGEAIVNPDEAMKSLTKGVKVKKANEQILLIGYDREWDTLSLWNGMPANYGETVAENLTAESNDEGMVTGITLENAAALLRPYLYPDSRPEPAENGAASPAKPGE